MIHTINIGYYEVRTTAQCDKVTVFTHSMPEKAMKHNDVYVDDAELVVIDASGVVISQPQPQAQPQPPAQPSSPQQPAVVNSAPVPTGFAAARWRAGARGESGRYDLWSVAAIPGADGSDFAAERFDQGFIDSHWTRTGDCRSGGYDADTRASATPGSHPRLRRRANGDVDAGYSGRDERTFGQDAVVRARF